MAADSGLVAMVLALALAGYGAVGSFLGAWRQRPLLVESARWALYLVPVMLAVSIAGLIGAFLGRDFSVRYVFENSNRALDWHLTWVAFYAGNQGSLLFLAFAMAVLGALAIRFAPRRTQPFLPYTAGVLGLFTVFLLAVTLALANPFARLPFTPPDGRGINPLLIHYGMFIHPPTMMTGLVSVAVPFSFGMGALLAGHKGSAWLDAGRPWGLVAWLLLSMGNLFGAWWAYTILGWGGYWAWDPVENAGIMPWFAMTAFIHSAMVEVRRGLFRTWNYALIILAMGLALFGMFMNRGGPVPSVHSFAQSTMGWVFLAFMGVVVVSAVLVLMWRAPSLKSAGGLESSWSREAAFLYNNLVLLAITFTTLWGEIYPLISQVFFGEAVTVRAPFYNRINGPLFLALLFLMALGPLLPWRRATLASVREAFLVPGGTALVIVAVLLAVGIRKPYAVVSFAILGMVAAAILKEWVHGTWVRHRRGEGWLTAFLRLLVSNRPRYGGYVVHLGIVVLGLGVTASTFYGVQRDVVLRPGEQVTVNGWTVQFLASRVQVRGDREEQLATLAVYRDGRLEGLYTPWTAFFPTSPIGPVVATRAAIRSTPAEDLYMIASEFLEDGSVLFRVMVNPMVWWMWFGAGPLAVLGVVVSLWPQRRAALATAPGYEGAVPQPVRP
ncbi:MAG: cytochrome c biogenesis protein CcsA [Dehalococcoidia bacterium]|nr:cytochrome c biogenesis protein CcsA [Dehalococcoidia bacterium]MDW8119812.1 cytochrome c-type biogenesis CcmF C-terminal domain-containing protein [Chloroflexota bacterium]